MSYTGAPYNFISLPRVPITRYSRTKELPSHKEINANLLSGEIDYQLTAMTDIMVGGQDGQSFYQDMNGAYVIQGSAIRGMIRTNMQILGLAEIGDDVEDYNLMYREVAGNKSRVQLKKSYKKLLGTSTVSVGKNKKITVSVCKAVKAGYITKVKGEYYLWDTESINEASKQDELKNYYIVREDKGKIKQWAASNEELYGYLFSERKKGLQEKGYTPYQLQVTYELDDDNKVAAIGGPEQYSLKGTVLNSGSIRNKRAFYIIPQKGNSSEQIAPKDIQAYQIDYAGKEKQLGKNAAFYQLPGEGECKAVFYLENSKSERTYFGFTPYLRVFYKHSIADAIPPEHKKGKLDYVKAIMGFSDEESSYKSRVFFEDAKIEGTPEKGEEQTVMLASPKPSSYYDYLCQDQERIMTYEDDKIKIRGYKQYWLRQKVEVENIKEGNGTSTVQPLKADCAFKGKIRFHNLHKDELGLLLWALQLKENCFHNIGKGKPYGFGRIKVENIEVRCLDYKKMYQSDKMDVSPYKEKEDVSSYVQEYQDYVKDSYGIELEEQLCIQEFFQIKAIFPDPGEIQYMQLDNYKDRKILPTIKEVALPKGDIIQEKPSNKRLQAGDVTEGIVSGKLNYGLFFNFPSGQSGLLHISNFKGNTQDALEDYQKGDKIQIRVDKVDKEGKLSLSFPPLK